MLSHRISFLALEIAVIYPRFVFSDHSLVNNSFFSLLICFALFSFQGTVFGGAEHGKHSFWGPKDLNFAIAKPVVLSRFRLELRKSSLDLASQDRLCFPRSHEPRKLNLNLAIARPVALSRSLEPRKFNLSRAFLFSCRTPRMFPSA